jgi:hypothetical protein
MTKTQLKEKAKAILNSHQLNTQLEGDDYIFIRSLIDGHPRAEQKIGGGIKTITVIQNPRNRNVKQFELTRFDGTRTDFSYIRCISGQLTQRRLFNAACRTTIEPQINEFRSQFSPQENNGTHVDHKDPSFNVLVTTFIVENDINVKKVKINGFGDGEWRKEFDSKSLAKKFYDFHKERAILQLIPAKENLSKPRV